MTSAAQQMIPKTVHFCWFSSDRFPPLVARCIESWHRHMPEWSFVLWKAVPDALPFAQKLAAGKRYAFASDYVRFYAIWQHGGIYLDVDVEVVRPFDTPFYTTGSSWATKSRVESTAPSAAA
jgi:mannosyltransferase OCH1-like enzyme